MRDTFLSVPILKFNNPTFKAGINLTVRRGTRWDVYDGDTVMVQYINADGAQMRWATKIRTRVFRFQDVTTEMLQDEHDPACRTYKGLRKVMFELYPDFHSNEMVTLVSFETPRDWTP
jgi:hypothetical protein